MSANEAVIRKRFAIECSRCRREPPKSSHLNHNQVPIRNITLTKQHSRWYIGNSDHSKSVVQPTELLGIAAVVIVVMVVRMSISVHLSFVVTWVVFHRLRIISMSIGVGVIVVFVVGLALAGFEMVLVFP